MDQQAQHTKPKNTKRTVLTVLCVVFLAIALVGIGVIVYRSLPVSPKNTQGQTTTVNDGPTVKLVSNPIDFAELQAGNSDIYAWITIPNTNIDYPICQNPTDDEYYLTHNSDGDYDRNGALYSEMQTSKNFTNPVSLIYGHYTGSSMFTELHYFENADFFNSNEYFYIYTPYHVITYRIISAYQYDDRHILNSFDFLQPSVKRSYYDMVCNPQSLLKNVREGATLSDSDRIVQLSTCMNLYSLPQRYIVTGVLVSDQAANR